MRQHMHMHISKAVTDMTFLGRHFCTASIYYDSYYELGAW